MNRILTSQETERERVKSSRKEFRNSSVPSQTNCVTQLRWLQRHNTERSLGNKQLELVITKEVMSERTDTARTCRDWWHKEKTVTSYSLLNVHVYETKPSPRPACSNVVGVTQRSSFLPPWTELCCVYFSLQLTDFHTLRLLTSTSRSHDQYVLSTVL